MRVARIHWVRGLRWAAPCALVAASGVLTHIALETSAGPPAASGPDSVADTGPPVETWEGGSFKISGRVEDVYATLSARTSLPAPLTLTPTDGVAHVRITDFAGGEDLRELRWGGQGPLHLDEATAFDVRSGGTVSVTEDGLGVLVDLEAAVFGSGTIALSGDLDVRDAPTKTAAPTKDPARTEAHVGRAKSGSVGSRTWDRVATVAGEVTSASTTSGAGPVLVSWASPVELSVSAPVTLTGEFTVTSRTRDSADVTRIRIIDGTVRLSADASGAVTVAAPVDGKLELTAAS